jgi:hypothetical protein
VVDDLLHEGRSLVVAVDDHLESRPLGI